jgi:ribosomal protein L11 methylase PrmA
MEETTDPSISHDDYLMLVSKRQVVLELKAQKADLMEWLQSAEEYLRQYEEAKSRKADLDGDILRAQDDLQESFKSVIEPLGVAGEFSITDTEPHYVKPIDPPQEVAVVE